MPSGRDGDLKESEGEAEPSVNAVHAVSPCRRVTGGAKSSGSETRCVRGFGDSPVGEVPRGGGLNADRWKRFEWVDWGVVYSVWQSGPCPSGLDCEDLVWSERGLVPGAD